MPAAITPPVLITANTPPAALVTLIIARLCALNNTDPQLAALLAQYQTVTGQPFGS